MPNPNTHPNLNYNPNPDSNPEPDPDPNPNPDPIPNPTPGPNPNLNSNRARAIYSQRYMLVARLDGLGFCGLGRQSRLELEWEHPYKAVWSLILGTWPV